MNRERMGNIPPARPETIGTTLNPLPLRTRVVQLVAAYNSAEGHEAQVKIMGQILELSKREKIAITI